MTEIEISLEPMLFAVRAFARAAALLAFAPWPSANAIPVRTRLVLAMLIGPILWLPFSDRPPALPSEPAGLFLQVLGDVLLGAAVGLSLRIALAAVSTATAITGLQMGLTLSAVADPETGQPIEPIGRAYEWMAIALCVTLGFHRQVIAAFSQLFQLDATPTLAGFAWVVHLGESMFSIGLRLAAPVFVCLFLTDLLVGVVGRLVPEVKALMVAHSLKLLTGLALLALALPSTGRVLIAHLLDVPESWRALVTGG